MSANSSTFSTLGAGKKQWQDYYDHDNNVQSNVHHGSAPFAKRQKLMSASEGNYDADPFSEDDDFTSDDFLAMDEMATQALTQTENINHSKTPKKFQYEKPGVTRKNAASPRVYYHSPSPRSRSSNSVSRKLNPIQTNIPTANRGNNTHGSKCVQQNKSLTNFKSTTCTSMMVSQSEIPKGTTASLTPPADQSINNCSAEEMVIEKRNFVGLQEFNSVKLELEKTKNEMKTLKNERFIKDGEIKVLRQNLNKLNSEMNKIQLEKIEKEQEAKTEKTEREKELQKQLEKLRTEIHFKDQELLEAQNLCKTMEQRFQKADGMVMSPTRTLVTTPPRKVLKSKSPSTPGGFPTRRSFMGQDGEMEGRLKTAKMITNSKDGEKDKNKGPTLPQAFKLCSSNKNFTGNYNGPRLLRAVLEKPASTSYTEKSNLNFGLISLLNPVDPSNQYPKSKETSSSNTMRTATKDEIMNQCETSLSQYTENMDLALRTILELLNSTMTSGDIQTTVIQLLPSLQQHLTLYIDYLDKPLLDMPTSSSMVTSASSVDTKSLDRCLNQNSKMATKDLSFSKLEDNAISALVVVQKLVGCCEAVTNRILEMEKEFNVVLPSPVDMDVSAPLISQSGTCKSTVSVHDSSHSPVIRVLILKQLFKLVSIQQKASQNTRITKEALKLLVVLSRRCEKPMLQKFKPLLTDECLQNLLDFETTTEQVGLVLDLLINLAANFELCKNFCNQKDSCLLLKLYEYCVLGMEGFSASQLTKVRSKIFMFLSSLMFGHSAGMSLILEADCSCSLQLVRSCILTLDNEYRELISTQANYQVRLAFIRHGLPLLHALSFNDNLFHDHRVDVEHYYVHLICGLSKLLKESGGISDQEVGILEELWDFDQSDDNDWEQESDETQTDMDVS